MPVITLEPDATHAPAFSGISVFGAASAHAALSDASDSSYCILQFSASERGPKYFTGEFPSLPTGAGVVVSVTFNVRALKTVEPFPVFRCNLNCGENLTPRVGDLLTTSYANYTSGPVLAGQTPAYVNAMQWMAGAYIDAGAGEPNDAQISKMNVDVNYNFVIGGAVAYILQLLGPLVAVGLYEMPRLSRELWKRGRVRLHPWELAPAWRELHEHRARRHVFLGA